MTIVINYIADVEWRESFRPKKAEWCVMVPCRGNRCPPSSWWMNKEAAMGYAQGVQDSVRAITGLELTIEWTDAARLELAPKELLKKVVE